ncbi:Uncharacterized protein TCM_011783 [Theobroma cacao]|uniref:Uncharacterized protein n=1 Tax=Theobroma cacao TaxID=3641 RepID=A0A061EBK2_THECC|nr:Uncharacterized protein TCM_011783 [Theobroma cacao]
MYCKLPSCTLSLNSKPNEKKRTEKTTSSKAINKLSNMRRGLSHRLEARKTNKQKLFTLSASQTDIRGNSGFVSATFRYSHHEKYENMASEKHLTQP